MISSAYRKLLIQIALIVCVITLYDVLLHSLFSVVHITFEWFELTLELIIEHVLHTNRQQSQIIVFYLLWLFALYGFYLLWRALPGFYYRLKEQLLAKWSQYKTCINGYWKEQSSIQRVKWITTLTLSMSCLIFFAFS